MIGNMRTAALAGKNGSIDWLCLPHFHSPGVLAATPSSISSPAARTLAVHKRPKSGKTGELLDDQGISAREIVDEIRATGSQRQIAGSANTR